MMAVGFDRPLYVLPFDHRGSFQTGMFGWEGRLTSEQTGQIAAAKRVIYDGFTAALASGVPKDKAGILVDEQFGAPSSATPRRTVTSRRVRPRRAGRRSSTSSMANASPITSRISTRRFARSWCATTRRAIKP